MTDDPLPGSRPKRSKAQAMDVAERGPREQLLMSTVRRQSPAPQSVKCPDMTTVNVPRSSARTAQVHRVV